MRGFRLLLVVIACCVVLPQHSKATTPDLLPPEALTEAESRIPGLSVVSPELIRGGQPSEAGLELLSHSGIKTVINLRKPGDADENEEEKARRLGMNYFSLPMSHSKQTPNWYIEQFLSIVSNPAMQPVFVHCKLGMDRTGAMVAIYRIDREKWSPTKSYKEMVSRGFHPIFRNLTKSVFSFAARQGRFEPLPPLRDAMRNILPRVLRDS